ncbi:MAG: hypothetical protein JWM80_3203 [Cyanobacteria bacterium RYN_339]|nr:hypothetical protein [Cyanobacteria bacterium RYN_339]
MFRRASHSLIVLTLLLAGCGTSVATAPKRVPTNAALLTSQPQAARPLPAAGQDQGKGQQLLAKVRQVLTGATGFSSDVLAKTEGHWKQGDHVDELRHVTMGYRITWAKPNKFRAIVTEAPTALMKDATLVTTDGKNVTARAAGLLSILPIHAQSNDKRIANARNHTFDKFNPSTQMQRLTGQQAVWTYVDQFVGPGGAPVVRCAIDGVQRLDAEIDREVIAVDLGTNAVKSLTSFSKGHAVVEYTFSKFLWNPKVTSDMFQL